MIFSPQKATMESMSSDMVTATAHPQTPFPRGTFCTVEVPKEFISWDAFVRNQIPHAPYDSMFLQGLPLDPLQRVLVQINGFVIKDYETAIKVVERSGEHLKLMFFEPKIVDTDSISGALLVLKRNNSHDVFAKAIEVLLKVAFNITNNPKNEKYHRVRMANGHFFSGLGNLLGGHQCMLALGFVAEKKSGEDVYQFSENKLETLKQAKETIMAASEIILCNCNQALLSDGSKKFKKVARKITKIHNTRFQYPQPGVCSLIKKHSPNAKTTRLGEEILVLEEQEHDAYKVVIGEVYSGDSPSMVQEKVCQLERNVRGYCDRCGQLSRSIDVDDDAFDVTSIVGLAVLHLNGCGLHRKQALQQHKKHVGNLISLSATPFLWRLLCSDRFVIHVVASEEAALTYEIMSIHKKLEELTERIQQLSWEIRMLCMVMIILHILQYMMITKQMEFLETRLELLETMMTKRLEFLETILIDS